MKVSLPSSVSKIVFAVVVLFASASMAQSQNQPEYKISKNGFVENKGQLVDQNNNCNPAVKYLFSSPGFNVQLRQSGFSYDTYTETIDSTKKSEAFTRLGKKNPQYFIRHYHRVDIELISSNPNAQLIADGKSSEYYNYFNSVSNSGVINVHTYSKVIYKNVYPNIDLEFFSDITSKSSIPVEYQFVVHQGGNPANIKLAYKGANKIDLYDGKLVINVAAGDFNESIPSSYLAANKQPVNVGYAALGNNVFTFSLPSNVSLTSDVIIDPVPNLVWGTYYGGTQDEIGNAITVDANNNVYITGTASSSAGVATSGAYQTTYGGSYDAFVAKFNPTGSALIWGTYYGGSSDDFGYAIAVDTGSNVYITGETFSTSGIATSAVYQTTNPGGKAGFVAKFNPSGATLLWGTYYGQNGVTYGDGIAVDANRNIYITGGTTSSAGISSSSVYQTTNAGSYDAFAAKFNTSLSGSAQLVWGTYYGGTGRDIAYGIALDANSNVYITGTTNSAKSIATSGTYQTTFADSSDAFIAKFNSSLSGSSQLVWGTYYGGSNFDYSNAIALDQSNNVFITGLTVSQDLPLTANTYNNVFSTQTVIGYGIAYVAEFNSGGTSLLWATYFGTFTCQLPIYISPNIIGNGIAVDVSGNAYITGDIMTGMCPITNMVTNTAYQITINANLGADYCYVAKFNPTLTGNAQLVWGTYYGGSSSDAGSGIAVDKNESAYVTGYTYSTDGMSTSGSYQTALAGSSNAFVAKFSTNTTIIVDVVTDPSPATYCPGGSATLTASGGNTYTWSPSTGLSATTGSSITANPTATTTYTLTGKDLAGDSATTTVVVTVNPNPTLVLNTPATVCSGESTVLFASGADTYTWTPSTGLSATTGSSVTATPTADITYTVTGTDLAGCSASDTDVVTIVPAPNKPTITVSVTGDSLMSSATQGNQWYFNDTLISGATNQFLVITGGKKGEYKVVVINPANGCTASSDSTTSINQLSAISQLVSIYPNPTMGTVFISINSVISYIDAWQIEVKDLLGRSLYNKTVLSHNNTINLSKLPAGVYFIAISNKTERVVYPVVKQN